MAIHTKWTQHLDARERDEFRKLLEADTLILGRLLVIVEEMEKELDNRDLSIEEYNSPAFPYLKADRNGERRGYNKIKQLLSFIKE